MVPVVPLEEIQLLEVKKLLSVPVLRAFFAQQMYEEILNRFAQELDPEKPLKFVQAEAYYKRGAELFEWLLNFPDSKAVHSGTENTTQS